MAGRGLSAWKAAMFFSSLVCRKPASSQRFLREHIVLLVSTDGYATLHSWLTVNLAVHARLASPDYYASLRSIHGTVPTYNALFSQCTCERDSVEYAGTVIA